MSLVMYAAVAGGSGLGATICCSLWLMTGVGFISINGTLATLSGNLIGSGVTRLRAHLFAGGLIPPEAWRVFFTIGVLGALTIISSFALCNWFVGMAS